MKTVFVAGQYSAPDIMGVLANIRIGIMECIKIVKIGHAPFCPWFDHLYAHYFEMSKEKYQQISIAWLKKSDAVYMIPGWAESKGAQRERAIAQQHSIPIFYDVDSIAEHFEDNG